MSNVDLLTRAGLLGDDVEPAERAAIESLTPDEIEALLAQPPRRSRTEVPSFHVVF
jgi:hypothetical protein